MRWVDINKGYTQNSVYRSRLVAKEFNTGVCPELYAAKSPSECLRLMLSMMASGRRQTFGLMYADVSRAYCYAKAVRPLYVKLPEKELEPEDEGKCGRLKISMYGTRDAALNWSLEYAALPIFCVRCGVPGRAGAELLHEVGPVLVRTRPRKPFWRMTASVCVWCSGSGAVRSTTSSSIGSGSGGCCSSSWPSTS